MSLSPGAKLSHFEILAPLGAGGMGEVYKARDTRLDRLVAIKVLPAQFRQNQELRLRFEREARTISNLTHSNICALYDIGYENETDFIVMEFLEGETLANRLQKGALPFAQAISYAIQIADALARAHRKGIIHRDLKPGNIMLTKSGAKLLDFGLAKFQAPPRERETLLSSAPTGELTTEGTILGTLGYMSPEQLQGKEADFRSDLFSLGAVLYEMFSGKRAFSADSQASLIAAVLSFDPDPISKLQPELPIALDRIVRTCLAKDPEDRFQTAHDLLLQLKWMSEEFSRATQPVPVRAQSARISQERKRISTAWIAGVLLLALLLASTLFVIPKLRSKPIRAGTVRFAVDPPEGVTIESGLAVSPDGLSLVFVGREKEEKYLWLHPLNSIDSKRYPGTEGASFPFWSPDNRFVGFFSGGKLKKIEVSSGSVLPICDAEQARGGTWNREGMILFSPHLFSPILRVSDRGGQPVEGTVFKEEEASHRHPEFLPDGIHFLYFSASPDQKQNSIQVGSTQRKEGEYLLSTQSRAVYTSDGYLLFLRDEKLLAQRFNAKTLKVEGDPLVLSKNIPITNESVSGGSLDFSVSNTGVLAYWSGAGLKTQLVWFDRNGNRLSELGAAGKYEELALSPEGSRLALNRATQEQGTQDIWLVDLSRGNFSRLTFHPGDGTPVWSPDGSRIAFASAREGSYDLYTKNSSGAGDDELLLQSKQNKWPSDFSKDGRSLIFESDDPGTKLDLWMVSLAGNSRPVPLLQTQFNETQAQLSPDGKYLAYTSDETGRPEVYVQNFPPIGGKWQISTESGTQACWGRDGKELFYLDAGKQLVAVPVELQPEFKAGNPRPLFHTGISRAQLGWNRNYVVSQDGQRLLVNTLTETISPSSINVVLNWTAEWKTE